MRSLGVFSSKFVLPVLAGNGLLFLYLLQIGKIFPFGGNILYNFGLGPELLADVYTLQLENTPSLPIELMYGFNMIGQLWISFILLMLVLEWRHMTSRQQQTLMLLLLLNGIYLPLMSITAYFDRYILLPIASLFIVLAPFLQLPKANLRMLPQLSLLLLMSTFALLATRDYLAWNRAKHQAFNYLIAEGVSIKSMDAGVEYNGFYNFHLERGLEEGKSFWWVNDDEYLITFGPVPGYEEIGRFAYYRWLWGKRDHIRVLRREKSFN